MSPERWSRIKDTFDRVLDEPPELRHVLVHSACIDEPELEEEIFRLLQAHDTSGGFLEGAAGHLHAYLQPQPSAPALQPGTILSRRFEVRKFINSGGMGEVYEAWDADLNEAVALKTILPHIAANPEIIERFKHEVRHAREVSHPNICRVHELFCNDEAANGQRTWFLSMELLRGITLLEHIQTKGSVPADAAVLIAAQLLSGLEAAHARGLVHRDLKSSNVMLLQQPGAPIRAVITDFGLAIGMLPGAGRPSDMPGTGTPGYMAPEQARGDAVGPLADQYSFGVVLSDMITGTLPQARSTTRAMPSARHSGYPAVWQTVIRRCTQPQPTARFRDMAAVRATLFPSFWHRRGGLVVAAAVPLLVALVAAVRRREPAAPIACSICDVVQMTPDTDKSESPSLSADGRFLAYSSDRAESGNLDIFVQALPSGALTRITRDSARDTTPSLSPDGSFVAYRSERGVAGIYVSDTTGQAEPRLLVAGGLNPKISPDGKSLLYWKGDPNANVDSGKVFRISLDAGRRVNGIATGEPQPIAATFADARNPVWSSDGAHILFAGCALPGQVLPACFDWWVADPHGDVLAQTRAYPALHTQNLVPGRSTSLAWVRDQIIFSAVSETKRLNLGAIALNMQTFRASGPSHWLLTGQGGDVDPSIAAGNRIAFTRASGALHIWQLGGIGGRKKPALEKVTADTEVDSSPFVSEGGRFVVFSRGRSLKRMIVLRDMARGVETPVLNLGAPVLSPIVDRGGHWIAYQQTEPDGSAALYAGELGNTMKRICRNCTEPSGWFDGDKAFFFRDGAHAISLADPRTGQIKTVLTRPGSFVGDISWSASTGWLAMITSKSSSSRQIEAVHLDPVTALPDRSEIAATGERDAPVHPRWFEGGKGIVYISKSDGFLCLYGRKFRASTHSFGAPFPLSHFHGQRDSIDDVEPRAFNLSADGETVYLNLGEQKSTIEIAQLKM